MKYILILFLLAIISIDVIAQDYEKENNLEINSFFESKINNDTLELDLFLEIVNKDSFSYVYYYFDPSVILADNYIYRDFSATSFQSWDCQIKLSFLESARGELQHYIIKPDNRLFLKFKYRVWFQKKKFKFRSFCIYNTFYKLKDLPIIQAEKIFYPRGSIPLGLNFNYMFYIKIKRNGEIIMKRL